MVHSNQAEKIRQVGPPPAEMLTSVGGPYALRQVAENATKQQQMSDLVRSFRDVFQEGDRVGRWSNIREFAEFLGITLSMAKRLLAGKPDYIENMQIGEIYRIAAKLKVTAGSDLYNPDRIERIVVRAIVQEFRTRRNQTEATGWPEKVQENDASAICELATGIGFIDEESARRPNAWQRWVEAQYARTKPEGTGLDLLVGLGDWLATLPHLPLFETFVYDHLHQLDSVARHNADGNRLEMVHDLIGLLGELKQLHRAFQRSGNGSVDQVAELLQFKSVDTVHFRARLIGLEIVSLQDPEASFGTLLLRSDKIRPFYERLFVPLQNPPQSSDPKRKGGER